jgi:hypothetical protein
MYILIDDYFNYGVIKLGFEKCKENNRFKTNYK